MHSDRTNRHLTTVVAPSSGGTCHASVPIVNSAPKIFFPCWGWIRDHPAHAVTLLTEVFGIYVDAHTGINFADPW